MLWRTRSWIELENGNKIAALKRLCSSLDDTLRKMPDDNSAISSTYVLKAHQTFSSDLQYLISTGDVAGGGLRGECLALLAYLTAEGGTEPMSPSQGNISAAMESIENATNELRARGHAGSPTHERLLQFAARLLFLNTSRGSVLTYHH